MLKLTQRQLNILEFIRKRGSVGNKEIREHIKNASRVTIVRDIDFLLRNSLICKEGGGRSVRYAEDISSDILRYIDIGEYFKKGPDERAPILERFNGEIFKKLKNIFSEDEARDLKAMNDGYKKRIAKLPPVILKKEFERLTIELSWKSSQIEGNTYSLLDTEVLIQERKEAAGHTREEAVMILNHKAALDYIRDAQSGFRNITLRKIENIHALLVAGLNVGLGLRTMPVGIVGTRYRPLDNEHQIREAMEKAARAINGLRDPFSKALSAILLISYIQPFADGNKRAGRLLGNALLLAHGACPLSFRSVNEADYKKALIVFYEQNNARFFKELFVEQFKFAVENYFL